MDPIDISYFLSIKKFINCFSEWVLHTYEWRAVRALILDFEFQLPVGSVLVIHIYIIVFYMQSFFSCG